MLAFDILVEQDKEVLEAEDLITLVQQINVLHVEFNRVFDDGSQPSSCKLNSVYSTLIQAPMFLAEYGFKHCEGLVEVPAPFGQLAEILDINNGLCNIRKFRNYFKLENM